MFDIAEEINSGRLMDAYPTGSNYICEPPVTNTDIDYICLVETLEDAHYDGWELGGSSNERAQFSSYKKKVNGITYNLILTDNEGYYDRFILATEVAKKLNLLKKEDRITLFAAIVDGTSPIEQGVDSTEGYVAAGYVGDNVYDRPLEAHENSANFGLSPYMNVVATPRGSTTSLPILGLEIHRNNHD